jgi:ribosomal protein L6P/L9E
VSRNFAIGLEAALECELDDQPVTVTARDGVIVVDIASSKDARSMLRIARSLGGLRSSTGRVNDALIRISHQLQVRVAETTVVVMGKDAKSGWLRLLGFPNLQVRPLRIFR